jgi:hypothetical protein
MKKEVTKNVFATKGLGKMIQKNLFKAELQDTEYIFHIRQSFRTVRN